MIDPAVTAPFLAATVTLGGAGAAKLLKPEDTAGALRAAGLPLGRGAVRVGAVAEVVVAAAAVVWPGPLTCSLVAASYAALSVFVIVALRKGWPLASCGCFGRPDTRPTAAHAALDAAAAGGAIWWAITAPATMGPVFSHAPWAGGPLVLVTLLIAGLAYLIWTNPIASGALK